MRLISGVLLGSSLNVNSAAPIEEVLRANQTGTMNQSEGEVWFRRGPQPERAAVAPEKLNFEDSLRTTELARASGLFDDYSTFRLKPLTILKIERSPSPAIPHLTIEDGAMYFSSRGAPQAISVRTPHATGVPKGTEFAVEVDAQAGRTVFTMVDGEVSLGKVGEPGSARVVAAGQQGIVEVGRDIAVLQVSNIVQWWIYYPAVLEPSELGFTPAERVLFDASLTNYVMGHLHAALKEFSVPDALASEAARIYYAGLLLAVGSVEEANGQLDQVSASAPLARALRLMIKAVTSPLETALAIEPLGSEEAARREHPSTSRRASRAKLTSSEFLALSYAYQATNELKQALAAAQEAVKNHIDFGFGWARIAELEFSFGRARAARAAVQYALTLSPRNAQAHALRGFLLAAANELGDAVAAFDQALAIDPALGNAWLGRGLCRRRLDSFSLFGYQVSRSGGHDDWLADLQTAASVEPTRALTRSYAGKAFAEANELDLAEEELEFAKLLDPNDPTPWLYGALLNHEQHRVNQSIRELERSIQLNDNRAVYRSRMLLDRDLAVRSSSLATLYQSAGMREVAVAEAARAVSYDYANYSAHLFLSESYNALRDPTRFNLRHETVWFNELLLANLLSPVGGTPLSQNISQHEYSRLFEQNRIGLSSSTEYRSDGQIRQLASQYGAVGNTGWAFDLDYQHNDGVRPNNELDRLEWYTTIKQQLSPRDSVMLLTKYQDYHSGDNFQYYDPSNAQPTFEFDEVQAPLAVGGYHHEWRAGVHTLLLGGRLENDQRFSSRAQLEFPVRDYHPSNNPPGGIVATKEYEFDIDHQVSLEIYLAEAQQIFENERHALVVGGRWQGGDYRTLSRLTNEETASDNELVTYGSDNVDQFSRFSAYAYETLKFPLPRLRLTAGVAYECLEFPFNFRAPPIEPGLGSETRERLNPKAALVWEPLPQVSLRGVYSESLGGVSLDQSFRLEPTQLAGFGQDFRTVIPESLVGSVAAPDHVISGVALDLRFKTGTYVGLQGSILRSEISQTTGSFLERNNVPGGPILDTIPNSFRQELRYDEATASVGINQLLANQWAFETRYSFVRSELRSSSADEFYPDTVQHADLHRLRFVLLYNHSSGVFAEVGPEWFWQLNSRADVGNSVVEDVPNESLLQLNLFVGYRFPRQRGDVTLGALNLTDEDYRLNPVTPYAELPRERSLYARMRFRF